MTTQERIDIANALLGNKPNEQQQETPANEQPQPQQGQPQDAGQPQGAIQPQPQQGQPQDAGQPQGQPQLTKEQIQEILNAHNAQMQNNIQAQLQAQAQAQAEAHAQANAPQEDPHIAEAKQKLGIDNIINENKILKEQIAQHKLALDAINQKEIERQQVEANARILQQIHQDIENFKKGKPENAEDVVWNYLQKNANNPNIVNMDTPWGWEMIYQLQTLQSAPQSQPDNIIPTGNQTAPVAESAFEKAKKGLPVSQVDLGNELLKMVGGQ